MVKDTTCSSNIETLAFHFALVGGCYILAVGLSKVLGLIPGFLGTSMKNMMFMNGMYAAYIVKSIMKKLKIDFLQENVLQNKITGWFSDYLIVCSFMAISINVISKWMVPILIVSVMITIITFIVCCYFGCRIGGANDFERTLGIYGTCTGTVPSGISLIRIIDPDFQTATSVELGACNLIMMCSTPVYILILALASGSLSMEYTVIGLCVCAAVYLAALRLTKSWGKKHIAGNKRKERHMDTLFYNGKIITMAEETLEEAARPEAVLVSNGLVKKVGSLEEVSRGLSSDVRSVNLQGKCLMPSFIDAHSHIVMNGQMSLTADLSECCSFEDIIDTLKQYAAEHKITNREIVVGFGYDHNFLKEQAHPDKRILDKASTDIPIIIIHVSGHLYCANSVALNLAGISQETENPPGGRLGRICGSNEPSGYMEEAGIALLQPVLQERIHIDAALMMEKMQDVYIRQGITTVQDGASTKESFTILKQMADLGKLKTDVVSYPLINADGTEIFEKNRQMDQKYRNHLKLGGYKIILDGSPQEDLPGCQNHMKMAADRTAAVHIMMMKQ